MYLTLQGTVTSPVGIKITYPHLTAIAQFHAR